MMLTGEVKPFNAEGLMRMIRQTVLGFKIERTQEERRAHGALALMAEYGHLPQPGSHRGGPSEPAYT